MAIAAHAILDSLQRLQIVVDSLEVLMTAKLPNPSATGQSDLMGSVFLRDDGVQRLRWFRLG